MQLQLITFKIDVYNLQDVKLPIYPWGNLLVWNSKNYYEDILLRIYDYIIYFIDKQPLICDFTIFLQKRRNFESL